MTVLEKLHKIEEFGKLFSLDEYKTDDDISKLIEKLKQEKEKLERYIKIKEDLDITFDNNLYPTRDSVDELIQILNDKAIINLIVKSKFLCKYVDINSNRLKYLGQEGVFNMLDDIKNDKLLPKLDVKPDISFYEYKDNNKNTYMYINLDREEKTKHLRNLYFVLEQNYI